MQEVFAQLDRVSLLDRMTTIATDGASIERMLTKRLQEIYPPVQRFAIAPPNTTGIFPALEFESVLIGGTPTVMTRDSKHSAKALRNSIDSGARVLNFAHGIVSYQDMLDLLETKNGQKPPIINRDVIKRDRQDDNAVHRMFSRELLQWAVEHFPDRQELHVVLYVFGELHSVHQNRELDWIARLEMAFGARYFLGAWERFNRLQESATGNHGLHPTTTAIANEIVDALVSLVRNYRDSPKWRGEALIPWRHSTELVEHFFGSIRSLMPNPDALEFEQVSARI